MDKIIYTTYAPDTDMTFILQDIMEEVDGDIQSTECVGFYFGEPDDEATKEFIGKLKAEYEW